MISGSTFEGSNYLSNVKMLGGIYTGSNSHFLALPVAGQYATPGTAINATAVLSSSFLGASGSVIQALNFLKASLDADAGGDVSGPGSSTDNAVARFNGAGGKTLQNSGVIINDSNAVSGLASLSIANGGTIGNVAVSDLITLNADGDFIFKDGAYDFDIASHDGTNGLALGGTIVTATAANLNLNSGVTAGTAAASKVLSLDGSKNVSGLGNMTSALTNVEATNVVTVGTLSASTALQLGGADELNSLTVLSRAQLSSSGMALTLGNGSVTVGSTDANNTFVVSHNATPSNSTVSSSYAAQFSQLTAGTVSAGAGGLATQAALTIGNSQTIGCVADSDLITLANQSVALANDVDFNVAKAGGFQIGGVAVTSTAAELNLLDDSAAGSVVNSKAVIYSAGGEVKGTTLNSTSTITGSGAITAQKFKFQGTNDSGIAVLYQLNVDGGMLNLTSASLG